MLPRRLTLAVVAILLVVGVTLLVVLDRMERGGGTGGMAAPAARTPLVVSEADIHPPAPVLEPSIGWQVSAPRPGLDDPRAGQPVEIGLRQRYADPTASISAWVEVTDPTGATVTAPLLLNGDAWTYLRYPTDVPGAPVTRAGGYAVRYLVDGQVVATDRFTIR